MTFNHLDRVFTLLSLCFCLLAQPPAQAQVYHVETIEEADGLPAPDIRSIAQDRWGVVWTASRVGLSYSCGSQWVTSDLDSLTSHPGHGQLATDFHGDLWAFLAGSTPVLLHQKNWRWESLPLPSGLVQDNESSAPLALAQADSQVTVAILRKPDTLFLSQASGWQEISLKEMGVGESSSLKTWRNQFILVAENGVFSIPATGSAKADLLPSPPGRSAVQCVSPNPLDGSLWLVGTNWIGKIEGDSFFDLLPPQGSAFSCFVGTPFHICQTDAFGGVYFSGKFSTQYFHPRTGMESLGPENGLVDYGSLCFFLDREKVFWQGTGRGISKILSRETAGFTSRQGLLTDEVTALLRRRDGTLVIGHNTGLTLWNDELTTLPFAHTDLRDRVLDLAEDSRGNVWIAGRRRGLGRLSPDNRLQWWPPGPMAPKNFVSVLVDSQDRVWIAASNKLLIFENGHFTDFPLPPSLAGKTYLRRLIKGREGTIYVATGNQGLLTLKDGTWRQWISPLQGSGNSVYDVLEIPGGPTWVGTRNGLFQLGTRYLERPSSSPLPQTHPVYFLKTDHRQRLWIGTDNGVFRQDGSRVDHLTAEDGLIGRETNRCACLMEPGGRTLVGTQRGLTIFNELFENPDPLPPLVYLLGIQANEKDISFYPPPAEITLPQQTENLVFKYRVLTTAEPKRVKLLGRLDGFDTDWVALDPANQMSTHFTHLPPGHYRFHLKAAGPGQPWSAVQSSPEILVPRPYWQQAWFLVVAGLLLITLLTFPLVIILQRRYTSRLKKEVAQQVASNLEIQSELEKTRNLRSLGFLAGGIAHDFNNLLTIIFGNLSLLEGDQSLKTNQQERVQAATGAIERARGLTNQLLTFSQGGAPLLEVGNLADLVRQSAQFVLRSSKVQCVFQLPDDLWPVVMDAGQMSQVLNNLLINAQEAMPQGGKVVISGRNLDHVDPDFPARPYVEISVADSGKGIDPENLDHIFDPYFSTKNQGSGLGLSTAFSILDRHSGKLTARSEPGQGSTFVLLLPASTAPVSTPVVPEPATNALSGTVLIMDDDEDVRQALARMVTSFGLLVEEVPDGEKALIRYEKMMGTPHQYQLVFMDLTIPGGLGGRETIGPLLKLDPDARAVVISGYSTDPVMARFRDFGFRAALSKPVSMEELGKMLHHLLTP